jgi:hypothetical protein
VRRRAATCGDVRRLTAAATSGDGRRRAATDRVVSATDRDVRCARCRAGAVGVRGRGGDVPHGSSLRLTAASVDLGRRACGSRARRRFVEPDAAVWVASSPAFRRARCGRSVANRRLRARYARRQSGSPWQALVLDARATTLPAAPAAAEPRKPARPLAIRRTKLQMKMGRCQLGFCARACENSQARRRSHFAPHAESGARGRASGPPRTVHAATAAR